MLSMDAQRDIVFLPIPSVRLSVWLSNVDIEFKWTDVSHFLTFYILVGASSSFLSPTAVTKANGNPISGGVKYTEMRKTMISLVVKPSFPRPATKLGDFQVYFMRRWDARDLWDFSVSLLWRRLAICPLHCSRSGCTAYTKNPTKQLSWFTNAIISGGCTARLANVMCPL